MGDSNRDLQETFQHLGASISLVFHEVLAALLILHKKTIILPNTSKSLDSSIADDIKYFPYFKNCLGALDGTNLLAHLPFVIAPPYQNRKSWLSQNVLGVCRMDFTFCYVLAGWEGSEHDDRVLEDALFNKDFRIPDGKYHLIDTRYHNTDYLLCPYRSVRYHFKEQAAAEKKPMNKKEFFNLRHSSLCNVVERIFGVTKRYFSIFKSALEYHFNTQISLVFVVTTLYNFIRTHQLQDNMYDKEQVQTEKDDRFEGDGIGMETRANSANGDGRRMNEFHDRMAEEMWQDYIHG